MRRCEHDNPSVEYKLGPICIHEEHGPMDGTVDGWECRCGWRVCGRLVVDATGKHECLRAAVDGDGRCDRCVADDELVSEAMKGRAA